MRSPASLENQMDWLCELYVNTMNVIHYMHDKYAYEAAQFALHDSKIDHYMALVLPAFP